MKYLILAFCCIFGVTQAVAQNGGYRLKAGDTIQIEVLEDAQLNRTVLVLPDGTINFPFAGAIRAGGRTVDQLQTAIVAGISDQFAARPTVFVSVGSLREVAPVATGPVAPATIEVFMLGELNSPGTKTLAPGTTFLQALAQSGGFSQFAATKRVQLRRTHPTTGQQSITVVNYKALSQGAEMGRSIVMQDGDVILVPERRLFE